MSTRLVLGCGSFGHALIEELRQTPGDLHVVSGDEGRVDSLRGENVPAELGAYDDPAVVEEVKAEDLPTVASVVVAGDDPDRNLAAIEVAREHYPDVPVVSYVGRDGTDAQREALEAAADRLVDPADIVPQRILQAAGRGGLRLRQLHRIVRELDGPLAVVMHDNPDPDAIASACALVQIAENAGGEAEPCYYGEISHQENLALVNLMEYDLTNLQAGDDLSRFAGFALVDHSRPGVNDQLPPDTPVDIVVDHHPPREPIEARFVDLRSDIGATSTLLTDYLRRLDVEPTTPVATGLLFGIRIDTKDFRREVSVDDYEAASYLLPYADTATLERVESPSVSVDTLETVGRAIRNREVHGEVLTSCVGRLHSRDALAQSADRLLDLREVTTTLVYGFKDGTIYMSARTRGTDLDVGETLREAFAQIGEAGGHADMAGAQLPLGLLGTVEEDADEDLSSVIADVVTDRFFETLRSRPNWDLVDIYGGGGEELPVGADEE
ncbi:DHH family phosphoesterase [Halomarina rubra]|uniref:DHH family phosphoesterase n=1 Tax=Halomarina rubra TaxID=2071873 RepID=A0ABD6ARX0_9EURY|nr:NAD-binding protein [Halomarina rubra]